jgi:hypothetical protein
MHTIPIRQCREQFYPHSGYHQRTDSAHDHGGHGAEPVRSDTGLELA